MLLSAGAGHAANFALRLQVIPLSNTDGTKAYNATPAQFAALIDRVNAIYSGTGIQFLFDEDTDWAPVNNTALNTDGVDENGVDHRTLGNQLAAKYPGKILCLLRWGNDPDPSAPNDPSKAGSNPTGNGNAYPPPGLHPKPPDIQDIQQDYVALPDNMGPTPDAYEFLNLLNGSFVGHELGHYLGLYHTFPGWGDPNDGVYLVLHQELTGTMTAAAADQAIISYMAQYGSATDPTTALDGDRLSDTPPDPSVLLYQAHGIPLPLCSPRPIAVTGTMKGQTTSYTFTPDIDNIMGYYQSCSNPPTPKHFSQKQIQEMIDTLTNTLSPRHALLSAPPECRPVTGCVSSSFWQFSLSCSGQNVSILYDGNCTTPGGESTKCLAGLNGSTSVTASWSGASGPPLFQTAASQETAASCTTNPAGVGTCINVTAQNLPTCPPAPSEPPPSCPIGQKLCGAFTPPRCVPINQCLVDPATVK
jgi:hypothetical protein